MCSDHGYMLVGGGPVETGQEESWADQMRYESGPMSKELGYGSGPMSKELRKYWDLVLRSGLECVGPGPCVEKGWRCSVTHQEGEQQHGGQSVGWAWRIPQAPGPTADKVAQ